MAQNIIQKDLIQLTYNLTGEGFLVKETYMYLQCVETVQQNNQSYLTLNLSKLQ